MRPPAESAYDAARTGDAGERTTYALLAGGCGTPKTCTATELEREVSDYSKRTAGAEWPALHQRD